MAQPAPVPSTKPYLVRAIYEWCCDNGYTPYVAVMVDANTQVPREYVKDGQIVLNIGGEATHKLVIGNDDISFAARFGGVARDVYVPIANVAAIYARENGQGMAFDVEELPVEEVQAVEVEPASDDTPPPPPRRTSGRPFLQRVK